jgi:hypothetical protein
MLNSNLATHPKTQVLTKDQKPARTTESSTMDKLNATILKTEIKVIPFLTMDNYSMWRNQVKNMLDLQELTNRFDSQDEKSLSKSKDVQLQTILTSKLDSLIHANMITHENEKSSKLIWKSISKFFALSEASNQARVFKELL